MDIIDGTFTTLRAVGRDENWLHQWIMENPSRIGLGDVEILEHELSQYQRKGGRLDMLAYSADLDTYYEIEIMLGECDADHGFRTLDYWARERLVKPNSKHFAVLIAEDLSGRYKTLIDTLSQFIPFIGIEFKVLKFVQQGNEAATILPSIVAQPDDLITDAGDEPRNSSLHALRDREWWEGKQNKAYIQTVDALAKVCEDQIGPSRVDYSAQSYISLKKGRRCWLPMWPRVDGVYVYLPRGENGSADAPSDFYYRVKQGLEDINLESPNWSFNYNAGANPIAFTITLEKATHSKILELLKEAYEFA